MDTLLRRLIRRCLATGSLTLLLATLAGLGFNALRSDSLPLIQDWQTTLADRQKEKLPEQMPAVELSELMEIYQKEGVLVVDSRPRLVYEFHHIPGARNLPVEAADDEVARFLAEVGEHTRIVVYCDGGSCHSSHDLGLRLLQAGHEHVSVYPGGMDEWTAKGLPVASDDQG